MIKDHLVSGVIHTRNVTDFPARQCGGVGSCMVCPAYISGHDSGLLYRYPRGTGIGLDFQEHGIGPNMKGNSMELGKAHICREGNDAAVIAYGSSTNEALAAAEVLEKNGVSVTVVDARFCKPLDTDVVREPCHHWVETYHRSTRRDVV